MASGAGRDWKGVQAVWLLAGSAGATAAVHRFLGGFRRCPPVAFIYAQHYDPARQDQLRHLVDDNKLFHMELIEGRHQMAPGTVLIVPPHRRIRFCGGLDIAAESAPWEGHHTPDIDELEVMLAAAGLPSIGVVLFSGMGSDGAGSLDVLDASGCRIWVQDPDTASCRGMPRAALDTGLVHRQGGPELLAYTLEQLYS
ncbi:chemotaxis protein CheB [Parahaliea mediterranea]|uniref:protein-glutamate methylesterase n=1 Tax=Parahaliea mediterranea TaxID=651086 RepID=A0A939DFG8_9GAMM|nr:chemotaxis protein CheB [Parahaliea mediterranea]MBN7797143.1 chemotaxis protein CheB [Parahaliea mediterranea]